MKCPKCDTTISNNDKKCPNCGAFISIDDDFNIDLPSMKKEVVEDVYNDSSAFENIEKDAPELDLTNQVEETNTPVSTEEVDSVIDDYDDKLAEIDKEIEKVQATDNLETTDKLEDTFSYHHEDLHPEEDNEVSSPTVNDILEYEAVLPDSFCVQPFHLPVQKYGAGRYPAYIRSHRKAGKDHMPAG